jgi:Ca2+/Na+ antiporter
VSVLARWTRAFGNFWWDFLVGDTPELFVATVIIVVLALIVGHHRTLAMILLPVLAVLFLVLSAYRGRQRTAGADSAGTAGPTEAPESEGASPPAA